MKTSQVGVDLIKSFEALRLNAYKPVPTEKLYTIGYGHYGVEKGMKITAKQAEEFLKQDLEKFEKIVSSKCSKLNLNQNEFDALVSFTFNCGEGNLVALVKNRNKAQIAEAITLYNKSSGKVLSGLVKRRNMEKQLFLTNPEHIENKSLPYNVKTIANLNIRKGPGTNYAVIKTVKKGTLLTVWAEQTEGNMKWGKNCNEWYCLDYCEKV